MAVTRCVPHAERDYLPLTAEVLAAHLSGKMHVGLYPLLDGDRCWWLAADFDGPEAMFDALMYQKAARALQVPAALRRGKWAPTSWGRRRQGRKQASILHLGKG